MSRALVAIGSNLGDRRAQLDSAVARLRATPDIEVVAVSSWHETAPVGGPAGQGAFLNGALLLKTSLEPEPLRQQLGRVELELGRERDVRWQARLLDLDLLLYDQRVIATAELVVPHPRMAFRRFVLEPAAEIAPDMIHPLIGWRIDELLKNLNAGRPYVAVTGVPGVGKTRLATALAADLQGRAILLPAPARTAPDNPLQREIDFMETLTKHLRPANFPAGAPVVLSDFWLDQTLAYAQLRLDAAELDQFREAESLRRHTVSAPTLLVLLTTDLPAASRGGDERLPLDRTRLQNGLATLTLRRGVGPVLQLSAHNPQQALDEVRAAVTAML